MTEVTVSARIPREMEKEVEELMREEHLEKSAALRKILHLGLEGYRRARALRLLSEHKVTLSKAAEIAKVSIWEILALAEITASPGLTTTSWRTYAPRGEVVAPCLGENSSYSTRRP